MRLLVVKYGEILSSRIEGREAALGALAYEQGLREAHSLELDFAGVKVMTPSWLGDFVQTLQSETNLKIHFTNTTNPTVLASIEAIDEEHRE